MPRTIAGRGSAWRVDSVASKANAVVRVSHSSSRANRVIVDGLLAIDEASMTPSPDLAALIALAETHDAKVIIAGDARQMQAVQNGGGMTLLADRLGHARFAEPVRFHAPWEQAASLRLRDGDVTLLGDTLVRGRENE